jgi:hypothetical protein
LELFRDDLNRVNNHLRDATSSEAEFNKRYSATMTVVPRQLSDNLDIIATRGESAAETAGDVSVRSSPSRRRRPVVMALQFGDITRQCMEHVRRNCRPICSSPAARRSKDQDLSALSCPALNKLSGVG